MLDHYLRLVDHLPVKTITLLFGAAAVWHLQPAKTKWTLDTCTNAFEKELITTVHDVIRSPEVLSESVQKYRRLRATCEWKTPDFDTIDTSPLNAMQTPGMLPNGGWAKPTFLGRKTDIQKCSVWDGEEEWQIIRVGPYVSSGGNASMDYIVDKLWMPDPDVRSYVTDSYSFVSDEVGMPITNPVVHYHHLILCHGEPFRSAHPTHPAILGDYFIYKGEDTVCPPGMGGVDCMYFKAPQCFGQPFSRPLSVSVGYNDIRAKNSPPMPMWTETGLKVRRTPVAARMKHELVWIAMTSSQFDHNDLSTMFPGDLWPNFFAVPILSKAYTVYWITSVWPFDGEMLFTYTHDHRIAEKYVHVWGAPPEAVGLNQGKLVLPDYRKDNMTSSMLGNRRSRLPLLHHGTIDEFTALLKPAPPGTAECSPAMSPTHPIDPSLGTFLVGSYDHMMQCDPWRFKRGDYQTLLCISQAPMTWKDNIGLGQHCNLHSLVVSDKPVDRMYETQYYALSESPAYMYGESPELTGLF